jgi:two-component system response regulator
MSLVFVVDDSAEYGFLLKFFMGRFLPECEIRLFSGGQELIDQFIETNTFDTKTELPAVMLIDLYMTPMDGYELLKVLKNPDSAGFERWKDIPIAINSSDASDVMVQKCYDLGVTTFLKKSADLSDLHSLKDFLKTHFRTQ